MSNQPKEMQWRPDLEDDCRWSYTNAPWSNDWASVDELRTGLGRSVIGYSVGAGMRLEGGPLVEAAQFLPAPEHTLETAQARAMGLLEMLWGLR